MNIFIFSDDSDCNILNAWSIDKQYQIHFSKRITLSSFANVYTVFMSKVHNKEKIFIINYDIKNMKDLHALESFINYSVQERKWTYYAPRPNRYFNVNTTAMISIPNAISAKNLAKDLSCDYVFSTFSFINKVIRRVSRIFKADKKQTTKQNCQQFPIKKTIFYPQI